MKSKPTKLIKFFAITWLCITVFSSCLKTTLYDREYLIFGQSYSQCDGDCAHYLLLEDKKVYRDYFNITKKAIGYRTIKTDIPFDRRQLTDEKFKTASWVQNNFPDYLIEHPGQTFGSPDSRDQGAIYVELKKKGKKAIKWNIDWDENAIPPEIRSYVRQMKTIIKDVYF